MHHITREDILGEDDFVKICGKLGRKIIISPHGISIIDLHAKIIIVLHRPRVQYTIKRFWRERTQVNF